MISTVVLAALLALQAVVAESRVTQAKAIVSKAVATESEPLVPLGALELVEEADGRVRITGSLNGLPAGLHGFHIHEHGGYFNNCNAAGAHFNPTHKTHGAPTDSQRHVGDLGNVEFDSEGNAKIVISDSVIALNGPHSVVGRSVVVHEKVDDLGRDGADSKKTGNAGKRLGCGVIGIVKEESASYAVQPSA